jgi:hypothetical protein
VLVVTAVVIPGMVAEITTANAGNASNEVIAAAKSAANIHALRVFVKRFPIFPLKKSEVRLKDGNLTLFKNERIGDLLKIGNWKLEISSVIVV